MRQLESRLQKLEKQFNADETTVQDRQVTVQVLTIGTKQVTQSMYKQMIEEDVIDYKTCKLKGETWGWVNLHSDCMKKRHLHVVWENNGQLRRSCTPCQCPLESYSDMKWWLEQLGKVYLCKRCTEDREFRSQVESSSEKHGPMIYYSTALDISGQKLFPQISGYEAICRPPSNSSNLSYTIAQAKIIEETHWGGQHFDFTSHVSIYDQMKQLAIKITDIESRWSQAYQTIQDAGQLFIAVSGVWK